MRFELPDCRRCCLCVPLRHGILIFGYLNLLFSLFVLSVELWMDFSYAINVQTIWVYRGVTMYTQLWFIYLFDALEIVFNIVLLVGAHRKDTRVIRVYYYYGIVTTLAVFVTYLVVRRYNQMQGWHYHPFEFCLAFSGITLQCYLLLLIRTELNKLQYLGGPIHYVNHMAEVVVEPLPPGEGNPQEYSD